MPCVRSPTGFLYAEFHRSSTRYKSGPAPHGSCAGQAPLTSKSPVAPRPSPFSVLYMEASMPNFFHCCTAAAALRASWLERTVPHMKEIFQGLPSGRYHLVGLPSLSLSALKPLFSSSLVAIS